MDGNKRNIYAVIWGQCSLAIQAKVKQGRDYTSKHKDKDCAWLLNQIKSAIYKFDAKRDIFYSLVEAIATLEFTKQQKKTDEEFYDTFRSHVEAFEHFGGTIGNDDDLLDELRDEIDTEHPGDIPDVSSATAAQFKTWIDKYIAYEKKIKAASRERYLAMMFLKKVSREKYGSLWTSLKNNYSRETK
jgi:hypothetical protein